MIIKLTYYGTNRPTLINLDNVESIYEVYDKTQGRFSTKVCFRGNDSFVNVEEDLKTLMKIYQDTVDGKPQEPNWESQSIDNTIGNNYQQNYKTRPRKTYNRENSYNENLY